MTSAQVFCFCCRIRLELKFRCLSWHALTGLLLGLRGLCPGFFLLGLLPTLLYLKQSVIKSARISMLPYSLWDRILLRWSLWSTIEYRPIWLACKVQGPPSLVSCGCCGGLGSMLTMVWGCKTLCVCLGPLLWAQFELQSFSSEERSQLRGWWGFVLVGGMGSTDWAVEDQCYNCLLL